MTLAELQPYISGRRYFNHCKVADNKSLKDYNHAYADLPPRYQMGIKTMLAGLLLAERAVYCYELRYVANILNQSGVKLKSVYELAGIRKTFACDYHETPDMNHKIHYAILKLLNLLLDYINEQ